MKLYDAIFGAQNTHKFKNKTIPYAKLFAILEAGYAAHAIGNVPSTKILIVETESIRNKISAISGHNWISSAPVVLVVCSDNGNLKKLYGDKEVSKYALQNSAATTQNILLAAREFGIQGSWISDFSEKRIASLLSIPDKIQIHNLIALGFTDQHFDRTAHNIAYDRTFYEEWKTRKRVDKMFPLIKKKHVNYIRTLESKIDKKLTTTHEKIVKRIGKTIKHFK